MPSADRLFAFSHPPGYWRYETSGVLRPAIEAYLACGSMTPEHIAAMRAYLRQWINADGWVGEKVDELRGAIDGLTSREALAEWLVIADDAGLDPL